MFSLFNNKKKEKKNSPELIDLDNNPLAVGDLVFSHRYDLGECRIVSTENGIEYESLESGERVSWIKMIDAVTERQKVNKIMKEQD